MKSPSRSISGPALKASRKGSDLTLLGRVEKVIIENSLIKPGGKIVLAVSGGPDSMALFSLFCDLRRTWELGLTVLYCHHGLRAAADEEESFVREWAKHFDCPFISRRLSVREYHKKSGKSLQDAARELRYRVFEEERQQSGFDQVALGHTANDQAEEVLIGLIRGTGLGGLAGIRLTRGPFIRPLLRTSRLEILRYLDQKNLPYKEDASNAEVRFLRARIRHHLIEELKGYSPNIINQLNQMAGLLQKDEEYLQEQVSRVMANIVSHHGAATRLNRSVLGGLPQALATRVIQRVLLERLGNLDHIRSVHILSFLKAAQGASRPGSLPLPKGWSVHWDRQTLTLEPTPSSSIRVSHFSYSVKKPGRFSLPGIGMVLFFKKVKASPEFLNPSRRKELARVNFDLVSWPLVVRNHRPGDRFQPFGMEGSKKVSRFFMDRRVPAEQRSRIPLICSGEKIIWVAGLEIDQAFRLDVQTTTVLEIVYRKEKDG